MPLRSPPAKKVFFAPVTANGNPTVPGEPSYLTDQAKYTEAEQKFADVAKKYAHTRPGQLAAYYAALSDDERWSLAFYVLSLRHSSANVAAGKRALAGVQPAIPSGPRELSALTEEELSDKLAPEPRSFFGPGQLDHQISALDISVITQAFPQRV